MNTNSTSSLTSNDNSKTKLNNPVNENLLVKLNLV